MNTRKTGKHGLTALAIALILALTAALLAPGWYVHHLTTRYAHANGPLWTAEVQRAWGNVLDPLWEANHGAIQHLGEAIGLDPITVLTLPMRVRRFSALITGDTVDSSDAVASSADAIPLVYGAPPSLLKKMREKDPDLRSEAGRRLLATMAGFKDRTSLDNTDYDVAARTGQAQAKYNPYAQDGFRTHAFLELARYAIIRYQDGDAAARSWYMHRLCTGDWDYDVEKARAALRAAAYPPTCAGYKPLPTFAQRLAAEPGLPQRLWGPASKRFGIDIFVSVLVLAYIIIYPLLRALRRRAR